MSLKFKVQGSRLWKFTTFRLPSSVFCLLLSAFCLASCSVPNLESPACAESRGTAREFYSAYFGNETAAQPENFKPYEKYLTDDLFSSLRNAPPGINPLTLTPDFPKAFRIGRCKAIAPDKTNVEIVLFWRDETRSRQRTIFVEALKQNDKWLINRIFEQ